MRNLTVFVAIVLSLFVTTCLSSEDAKVNSVTKRVLTIGTEGTYQPFTYHNKEGELVGYDVEVGRAIADELGLEVKFYEVTWEGLLASLDNGQVDFVVNQVGITPQREQKYIFSTPYLYSYPAIIVRKDDDRIKSFEDIKGKKTSLNISSNFAILAERFGAQIVPSETFSKDIELLLAGRTDLVINDTVAFADYLKQKPDTNIRLAATLDEPNVVAIPFRKDSVDLQKSVNDAIAALQEKGVLKSISQKYLDKDLSIKE